MPSSGASRCHRCWLHQLHRPPLRQQRISDQPVRPHAHDGAAAQQGPYWQHNFGLLLQVAASLDGGGLVEVLPPPFAGLAWRSDFMHAWGLAHVLPCISCTGGPAVCRFAARQLHHGASCPSLLVMLKATSWLLCAGPSSSAAVLITS